jgi:putative heme transporter
MRLGRFRLHAERAPIEEVVAPPPPGPRRRTFEPPVWMHDVGLLSWLLVGVGLVLVGLIVLLAETATIVVPVVAGTVVAAVASPLVAALQRRGAPRVVGALLVLLLLIAIGVGVVLLVLGGIVAQGDEIRAAANTALEKIEAWANDAGADGTQGAKESVASAVPNSGEKLLRGVVQGIEGLTSVAFFVSFTIFTLFFVLKDGPKMRHFVQSHVGLPVPVAAVVTGNVLTSLRRYFLGVTIVAAFNAVVVCLAALALDVPLAGTIAVVTLVTAYVPFIGAVVAGAFAVMLALASEGTTTALIMLVVVILANGMLQNIVQPIAFGATLNLNPLAVLVVTIAGGSLFGMVGLILAAPLTSAAVHIHGDLARLRAVTSSPPGGEPPESSAAVAAQGT